MFCCTVVSLDTCWVQYSGHGHVLCSLMLMAALVAVRWLGSVVSWVRVKAASHSVCTEAPSRHLQYSTVQYSTV